MSKYTTGEMAKLCNVSVRTVQFYDAKGLLPPSELTDGGRRLYTDDDLTKLRLICMLKALGLSLDSIQGILSSKAPGKVLMLLLEEQTKQLDGEIKEKQEQIDAIKIIKESIRNRDTIPVNSIGDIDHMMKNKKGLRKVHGTMLGIGLILDALQIAAVVLWITKGLWIPFAIGMPFVVLFAVLTVRMYHRNTAYICAECGATFRPVFSEFFFASHTPKTRKLTCAKCGHKGYCVEIYSTE
jgi:DNA-binding transcriptional MerR regulator/DNA-directed RNA polymerase subunit RPC12/RpoP